MGDIYLWRQVLVLFTNSLFSISFGQMLAFPSILITDLLSTNSSQTEATSNQIGWIAPSGGIGAIFGFFVFSPILHTFGRKVVHIIDCLFILIGWIIFALTQNITELLVARVIQGLAAGAMFVRVIILSEYSAPSRRGYFVTISKASTACGVLMCHSLSLIWNWQQIAMFAIILPTLAILLTLLWPESYSFLAMKGRFKESEKSFIWLHGDSNLHELHLLHSSQQQRTIRNLNTEKWFKFLFKRDFMKPFVIVCLLMAIVELSGKHYLVVYGIQMIMELVGDESLAIYYTIGADLFIVFALIVSCFIISSFTRRTVLFSGGLIIVSLMLTICFVVFLKLPTVPWLAPSLIVLHGFIINTSVVPVCFTLFGELIPLEYKGWGSCLSGIVGSSLYMLLLKITPCIMQSTGVGGVYATYGIAIAVCFLILYFIIPETKDRTLTEIENEFKAAERSTFEENKQLQMID